MVILNHHPEVNFSNWYYMVELVGDDGRWPDRDAYLSYLATDRIFQSAGLTIDKELDYPSLVSSFLDQKRDQSGKPIMGGKIRDHFHRILRIWPEARFIHLLRDGRDVARSLVEMGWVGNMHTAGEYWLQAENEWDKLKSMISPDQWTELRYEDLVSDPEPVLRRLCEFMGVPYDSAMLSYPNDTTYEAPSARTIGQWKRKLSRKKVQLAEARIGPMLVDRGYELSGYPVSPPRRLKERLLRVQDRLYRVSFKTRKYGFFLYAADYVTRRLRLEKPQFLIRRRLNEIDLLHLK